MAANDEHRRGEYLTVPDREGVQDTIAAGPVDQGGDADGPEFAA
jgi:hypothetical protein